MRPAYLLTSAQLGLDLVHPLMALVFTGPPRVSVVLPCFVLLPAVPRQRGAGLVRGPRQSSGPLEPWPLLQEELARSPQGDCWSAGYRGPGVFWKPRPGVPTGLPRTAGLRSVTLSLQSRSSVQQGDLDGARRLGRLARMLSIAFIIIGIIIIIVATTVNFAGEVQSHTSSLCVRAGEGVARTPGAGAVAGKVRAHGNLSAHSRKATQAPTCLVPQWVKEKGVGGRAGA